jgi:hypothetical protein
MNQLSGNELVSYQTSELNTNNQSTFMVGDAIPLTYDCCVHSWSNWYPSYHYCEKSKIEQAFKIIGKLMEGEIITKELTVKEFMKLVNDIAGVI